MVPVNGVYICKWQDCENAGFASLADVGVHIRAIHIADQKQENRIYKMRGSRCFWRGCDRSWDAPFNSFYNLEMHIRYLHTGERPFACEHPGCSWSFCQASDLTVRSVRASLFLFLMSTFLLAVAQASPRWQHLSKPFSPREQCEAQKIQRCCVVFDEEEGHEEQKAQGGR